MLVMAKCTARAWDNQTAREYLPGHEYEIDSESPLAQLTVRPVALDEQGNPIRYKRNLKGEFEAYPVSMPEYIFQFERTERKVPRIAEAPSAKEEKVKAVKRIGFPRERKCPECGKPCRSDHGLRIHIAQKHKVQGPAETEPVPA